MIPKFLINGFEFFARKTRTRFPFRYGIASMTEVPHLFVRVRIVIEGQESTGLTSEGLPPKWFTKDPATTFEQDLPQMLEVIGHATKSATEVARYPVSFFELWREVYRNQCELAGGTRSTASRMSAEKWDALERVPATPITRVPTGPIAPLLANLGVSLVERAVLDAFCRALNRPLHQLLRDNLLGLDLGQIYPELRDTVPSSFLPAQPRASVLVRHTVGLADPLTPADIREEDRVDDGLPHDLEGCIRAYGLRAFKIKLSGNAERDVPRLRALQSIIGRHHSDGDYVVTLDGNENFKSFPPFQEFWQQIKSDPSIAGLCSKVVVIEQPVHRQHALEEAVAETLQNWKDRPPLIIDESDGNIGDFERALRLGYSGVSHKNCKGIVKSLAHACLLESRRRGGQELVLTAEDLCNLGPVVLLQDVAMVALLGVPHVERNGHHYFRGLSMWPDDWQQSVLAAHPDIYRRHPKNFPAIAIQEGALRLDSVNAAPFGLKPLLDPSVFEPVSIPPA